MVLESLELRLGEGVVVAYSAPDASADAAAGSDAGSTDAHAPDDSAAFPVVQGCTASDYQDRTADSADRTITPWDLSLSVRCLTVKVEQSVTRQPAPSSEHPLVAAGGKTPNPITDTATITFNAPGIFGFACSIAR